MFDKYEKWLIDTITEYRLIVEKRFKLMKKDATEPAWLAWHESVIALQAYEAAFRIYRALTKGDSPNL